MVLSVVAVLIAVTALVIARRATRKLEALNQSYWELRYDFTRLRSQVSRLDPGEQEAEAPPPAPTQQVAFVPLSSMKKKNE